MRLPDRLVEQMITPRRKERRAGSPCAAACVAELDPSKGTEEYGAGRMECCNPQGRAAVLLVWAVPEGGSS
jgi:hypothetical protein